MSCSHSSLSMTYSCHRDMPSCHSRRSPFASSCVVVTVMAFSPLTSDTTTSPASLAGSRSPTMVPSCAVTMTRGTSAMRYHHLSVHVTVAAPVPAVMASVCVPGVSSGQS